MQIYPRSSNLIHFWEFIHEPAIRLIIHTTSPSRYTLPHLDQTPVFPQYFHQYYPSMAILGLFTLEAVVASLNSMIWFHKYFQFHKINIVKQVY